MSTEETIYALLKAHGIDLPPLYMYGGGDVSRIDSTTVVPSVSVPSSSAANLAPSAPPPSPEESSSASQVSSTPPLLPPSRPAPLLPASSSYSLPNFTPYANLLSCIFSTFSTPPPLPSHFSTSSSSSQDGTPGSSLTPTNSLSLPPNASVNVNTSPTSVTTNYVSLILCTADVFLLLPTDFQRRFLDVIYCVLSGGGDAGYKSGRTSTWSHHSEVLYSVVRLQ